MNTEQYIEQLQNRVKSLETELELYRNQELYSSMEDISRILENKTEAVILFDFTGNIIDLNDTALSMLANGGDSELQNKKLQNFFSDTSPLKLFDIIKDFNKYQQTEGKIILKGKSAIETQLESTFYSVNYENSKVVLMRGIEINADLKKKKDTAVHIKELEYLSESAMKLMSFSDETDIFSFLCSELYKIVPRSLVITLEWDRENNLMELKDFKGFARLGEIISKYLGESIYGMKFPISPEGWEHLSKQKLLKGPMSIYRIAEKKIPKFLADLIERIIGLEDLYVMGIMQDEIFLGEVIIFIRKGGSIGKVSFLESFINQAAIAIQRQKARKALLESEAKYRSVVDNANEAIFVVTDGKFAYLNPTSVKLSGYSEEELYQMAFSDVIYEKDNLLVLDKYKKRLAGEELPPYDFRILTKNNDTVWVTLNAKAIDWNGKKSVLCFVSDISEKKSAEQSIIMKNIELRRAEEELRESYEELRRINADLEKQKEELRSSKEKAEESDRLKSAFLANMSHEIRTPMNGILGFSSLLSTSGLDEEERKEYIDIINKSGSQLLNILNDILEISRIESGQLEIVSQKFYPAEIIDDLHGFYQPYADEKNLEFFISMPEYLDSEIYSDKVKIRQILSNLLSNAFKFTDFGSITFGFKENQDECIFYVQDTGIGIKPEHRDIIFDRFRQVELELTRVYGGTGLGLSICGNYAKALGGRIHLESEFGKGSVFSLILAKNN